jgi:hypothetical protein
MIILTVAEIIDLAEFAGLTLDKQMGLPDEDQLQTEITIAPCSIAPCSKTGVLNGDGVAEFYAHVAYFSEYPDEGFMGLGKQLK